MDDLGERLQARLVKVEGGEHYLEAAALALVTKRRTLHRLFHRAGPRPGMGLRVDAPAIIVLTARANPARRDELLRSGAQDYLLKPFSTSELLARLNNLVATAKARFRRPSTARSTTLPRSPLRSAGSMPRPSRRCGCATSSSPSPLTSSDTGHRAVSAEGQGSTFIIRLPLA